jgi:hypothetical protein
MDPAEIFEIHPRPWTISGDGSDDVFVIDSKGQVVGKMARYQEWHRYWQQFNAARPCTAQLIADTINALEARP